MRGARLGRGRPNRPVIVRNGLEDAPSPVIGSVPVIVVSPWRPRPRARCGGTRLIGRNPLVAPVAPGDPVQYVITGPHRKWELSMALERMSRLSRKCVPFHVSAYVDGQPWDPSSAIAEAAFLPSSRAEPNSGDWKACSWNTNLIGTHEAQCLVGPGGTVTLPVGTYFTWLRVTDSSSNEEVVEPTGRLIVE